MTVTGWNCSPPVRSAMDALLPKGSALLIATVAASRPFHAAIKKTEKIRLKSTQYRWRAKNSVTRRDREVRALS